MRLRGEHIRVAGVGMTDHSRRDMSAGEMAVQAAREALSDAGLEAKSIPLVVVSNALGGSLCEQECIRGQSWLGKIGLEGAGVLNVDNACAGGVSAIHLAALAAVAGQHPVLAVGVEKMWTGSRDRTICAIEEALPAWEREEKRATIGANPARSVFMGLNAKWARDLLASGETTREHLAAAAAKARRHGALNPLAQVRSRIEASEILDAEVVADPLTRPMCSSFTDGAAAAVLTPKRVKGAPKLLASVLVSGDGSSEYHRRMGEAAKVAYEEGNYGPDELDVVEIHDATSAEELLALEALGFYPEGKAGIATLHGDTSLGGHGVTVNPSGGLVARGHPIGATGLSQLVELTHQLRGTAGVRQVSNARLAMLVNTGGIIGEDVGAAGVVVLGRS